MNQSASSASYVIQPPDFPDFTFKRSILPYRELVEWSKKEFQARLIYCAEHGYWKALKYYNEEYSPIRILAELHGFRRYCAYLSKNPYWGSCGSSLQKFIVAAYEFRELKFQ